jgi:hypothetical protein
MRTLIVAMATHPKLMGSILGLLTNMIHKQVGTPRGSGEMFCGLLSHSQQ